MVPLRRYSLRQDLFTGEKLEILFHAVVAGESIIWIPQRVLAVNLDAFYHEADVVGPSVLIEVWEQFTSVIPRSTSTTR